MMRRPCLFAAGGIQQGQARGEAMQAQEWRRQEWHHAHRPAVLAPTATKEAVAAAWGREPSLRRAGKHTYCHEATALEI